MQGAEEGAAMSGLYLNSPRALLCSREDRWLRQQRRSVSNELRPAASCRRHPRRPQQRVGEGQVRCWACSEPA